MYPPPTQLLKAIETKTKLFRGLAQYLPIPLDQNGSTLLLWVGPPKQLKKPKKHK